MSQDIQKCFVVFKAVEGGMVAVRKNNITYARPRIDGNGVFIAFPGDDGVGVEGTLDEVLAALEND